MPKKLVDTSPRRWGTRFDTLVPASPSIPQTELHSPSTATPQLAHPSVRPVPPGHRDLPKLPHDASVFVGSLPSAVDHRELIRALYDHLSPYTEIHNIKVVRDPRHGGVCAFVQCESAESAAQLITTLHANPPPPFFGRTLRYERARSLRALLVSYRAPTAFTPSDPSSGDVPGTGSLKPIDPATAMRLYKTQGARFFSIKYNESAREHLPGNTTAEDGLLLSPLTFDAEAIRQIVSFFGPVDEVKTYALDTTVHPLHTASRLTEMDSSVWEVNFNHRDDALNALMTLRTVPHLTVTWAHQSSPQEQGGSSQETPIIPPVEEKNNDPPGTTLPRAQSDAALSRHSSEYDDKGTDLAVANSDIPTRRNSLSEDGFPPLVGKPVSWADDETLPPSDSSRTLKTTSEYGSVPPTPGFTSGSISPTTPLTFSSTPATPHSAQFPGGFASGSGPLQYDYTSLFVGGLPPSWEEENVRDVFGRFPGLEEVQLIRPTMKKGSSFAFVKFDNTESPRKAIDAENDHIHDGRRIRVQIRDLNPPGRFAWKRGIQRHLTGGENYDAFPVSDPGYALHGDLGGGSVNPSQPYPTIHQDKAGPLETSASVTTTPQPSTPGQQTSFVPYPYHTYYPATPWSYPHYPYPMHYYHGYPTYGHVQPYPPPTTAVYNPYAVMQPPGPTDPPGTSSQPPGSHTPVKPVYNATEHGGFYSDFQSDGLESCNTTTPPPGHLPAMAQVTPPPPASLPPPPVAGHPYPPYNPMQWTPAGPTNPHIHTPGVYMHFTAQAQTTAGRHAPAFPVASSAPHNHQQREPHRGRRHQRHQQRNTNGTDGNIFPSPNSHRQGFNHGFDHRDGVQPMPQWVNGGR